MARVITDVRVQQDVGFGRFGGDLTRAPLVLHDPLARRGRRRVLGVRGDVDCDHHLGAQRACDAYRHRARLVAVQVCLVAHAHRLELARARARGPHREARVAAVEKCQLAVAHARGRGDEGDVQLLDRLFVQPLVHVVLDRRAARQSAAQLAELEEVHEVQVVGHALQIPRGVASRVQRAHHGAHARADDEVGLDAGVFEHLEHADVREAARATRPQHQSDTRRGPLRRLEARQALLRHVADVAAGDAQREAGEEDERRRSHASRSTCAPPAPSVR